MGKRHLAVAIDGPSGAGKSTLSRTIASDLGLVYIDTGAMYRTIGLAVLKAGIDPKDEKKVVGILCQVNISMKYDDDGLQHMYLNAEDVTQAIRMPEISIYASDVSVHPPVRAFLLGMQRSMACENDVIMDGRDIGTVVLPEAELKLFLTASTEERARRRHEELSEKGVKNTFDEVLRDLIHRDSNDRNRAAAPLMPAKDAIILDTTGNSFEKSREIIKTIIRERFGL